MYTDHKYGLICMIVILYTLSRQWRAEGRGRTEAIPHIKTYTRVSPDWTQAAWFLVTRYVCHDHVGFYSAL